MRTLKRIAVALIAIGVMAIAMAPSANAARDVGHKAKVEITKTGGTLRVDVRARGGIQFYLIAVYCGGYEPMLWAHHGTTRQRLRQPLPNVQCDARVKARAHRGQVRVIAN